MGLLNKALALSEHGSLLVHASMLKEQIGLSAQGLDDDIAGSQKKKVTFKKYGILLSFRLARFRRCNR